ncbi:MAG: ankyrin repeat domain-containing protein [Dehalococcoidia bacterium]|nr:ankyrin repeat domain-containing protein [Dehalococcoidia bacterium]
METRVLTRGNESNSRVRVHSNVVRLLLAHRPRFAVLSEPDGRTALHVASAINDAAMVRLLLTNGADPWARDTGGHTPYDLAPTGRTRDASARWPGRNEP